MTDKWLFLQLQLGCIIIPQPEFKEDVWGANVLGGTEVG